MVCIYELLFRQFPSQDEPSSMPLQDMNYPILSIIRCTPTYREFPTHCQDLLGHQMIPV